MEEVTDSEEERWKEHERVKNIILFCFSSFSFSHTLGGSLEVRTLFIRGWAYKWV